jgi:hypothetical protein
MSKPLRGKMLNTGTYLIFFLFKGTVSRDFRPLVFHQTIPPTQGLLERGKRIREIYSVGCKIIELFLYYSI